MWTADYLLWFILRNDTAHSTVLIYFQVNIFLSVKISNIKFNVKQKFNFLYNL